MNDLQGWNKIMPFTTRNTSNKTLGFRSHLNLYKQIGYLLHIYFSDIIIQQYLDIIWTICGCYLGSIWAKNIQHINNR